MNKWEREVARSLLGTEKEVLKALEKYYRDALADIEKKIQILLADPLTQSRAYRLDYQRALIKQVSDILNRLHENEHKTIQSFLNDTYTSSYVGTMYSLNWQGIPILSPVNPENALRAVVTDSKLSEPLYESLGIDINSLKKQIAAEVTRGIAEGMSNYEIARNLRNASKVSLSRARTIARTESHRIQEAASYDAGKVARSKGADLVKQWDASLDGDTRPTHRELDGKIVEYDDYFVSSSGSKTEYPGGFGDPAEDINCRCSVLKRARSAMDESELKSLQERAAYFGLDKTQAFEDFKKKYLNATESIENSDNYGIILTGAKGALTSKNDPDYSKRDAHAKRYYSSIRNSDQSSIVKAISENVDIDEQTVNEAIKHIFYTKHQLEKGFTYFDEDYDMAQSIQRLRTGRDIQPHDLILLQHEALESKYMSSGMAYDEAHGKAETEYNYKAALMVFLKANNLE